MSSGCQLVVHKADSVFLLGNLWVEDSLALRSNQFTGDLGVLGHLQLAMRFEDGVSIYML